MVGYIEELFAAECDTSGGVGGCDLENNSAQDMNFYVAGTGHVGVDGEQGSPPVPKLVNSVL